MKLLEQAAFLLLLGAIAYALAGRIIVELFLAAATVPSWWPL